MSEAKAIETIREDVWNLLPYPWKVNEDGTVDLRIVGDIGGGHTGPICDVFGGKHQPVCSYAKAIGYVPHMLRIISEFCDSLGDQDTIPTQRQANIKARAMRMMEDIG
jgi:hypothetical protein